MDAREKRKARCAKWRAANRERVRAYAEANRERSRAVQAAYVAANKDKVAAASKKWRQANPKKVNAQQAAWRAANPEKTKAFNAKNYVKSREKRRVRRVMYRAKNMALFSAYEAKRRAAKREACPAWLSETQLLAIRAFYEEATRLTKNTGVAHEVDHIVPLQGRSVRGLHVPWNLQILEKTANISKYNTLCPSHLVPA